MASCMSENQGEGCNGVSNRSDNTLLMMFEDNTIEERESPGENRWHLSRRDSLLRVGP